MTKVVKAFLAGCCASGVAAVVFTVTHTFLISAANPMRSGATMAVTAFIAAFLSFLFSEYVCECSAGRVLDS